MTETRIRVEIDSDADAAYIQLSAEPIVETREITDEVLVDLDRLGMVVGVEVLALDAEIPFTDLVSRFHVHARVVELLRTIRPSVAGFISIRSAPEAASVAESSLERTYC